MIDVAWRGRGGGQGARASSITPRSATNWRTGPHMPTHPQRSAVMCFGGVQRGGNCELDASLERAASWNLETAGEQDEAYGPHDSATIPPVADCTLVRREFSSSTERYRARSQATATRAQLGESASSCGRDAAAQTARKGRRVGESPETGG
ncbi:hypothetical protein BU16DRAFT_101112 [Lophium mytilinum]|uniref:Uncharacterized protein n=1 Tax=Lophium mytilinum TaxID=390894 RepID=A0A6A6QM77_9PEZI|nr:hypothetical protein BU16DRAFT_101112 [Lophium mytilinum]